MICRKCNEDKERGYWRTTATKRRTGYWVCAECTNEETQRNKYKRMPMEELEEAIDRYDRLSKLAREVRQLRSDK